MMTGSRGPWRDSRKGPERLVGVRAATQLVVAETSRSTAREASQGDMLSYVLFSVTSKWTTSSSGHLRNRWQRECSDQRSSIGCRGMVRHEPYR